MKYRYLIPALVMLGAIFLFTACGTEKEKKEAESGSEEIICTESGKTGDSTQAPEENTTGEMSSDESYEEEDMGEEAKKLAELAGISIYAAMGAVETLHDYSGTEIASMELVSAQRGYIIKVTDSKDQVYYLGLGGLGFLEIIRKDQMDGEIVYAAVE